MKHSTLLASTTALTALAYNNADYGTDMTLPVGRIVWGHPTKPKPATDNHNQPKRDKDGNQMMEVSFGLAIPIDEFQSKVWPAMHAEMTKGYPSGNAPGNFSWKMTQPTDVDNNGKSYSEREGYAGHVVLAVSTMLQPPAAFRWDGAKWQQMEPHEIKCGDYVQVEINFKVNVPADRTHTPSMYVNPRQIAFVGYGPEIQTGFKADPNAAFGSGPPPLPPGASATPLAGDGQPGMPGAPDQQQQPGQPGNAPTMPGAPSAATATTPGGSTVMPNSAPADAPPPPTSNEPQRPTDPAHIHDNGDGTEQWWDGAAWDGGRHPAGGGAPLPPPATGFVDAAANGGGTPMPGQQQQPAAGGMPGAMPGR